MPASIPCLAVSNNKGGVGKTSIANTLGEYLCYKKGLRVALVDLDESQSLVRITIPTEKVIGHGLMPKENPFLLSLDQNDPDVKEYLSSYNLRSTLADLFVPGKEVMPYPVLTTGGDLLEDDTSVPRVDIIPGNREAFRSLLETGPSEREGTIYSHLVSATTEDITKHIARFVSAPELSEMYDIVILDCAPLRTGLFDAAMRAATHVLCPYVPEIISTEGIPGFIDAFLNARARRQSGEDRKEPLELVGLMPNKVDLRYTGPSGHLARMIQTAETFPDDHFPEELFIRQNIGIINLTSPMSERPSPGTVFKLPKSNAARQDMEKCYSFIHEKIFGEPKA